jgi:ABC-type glycerol-3-phosphate transport system substrate-binding protein
MSTGHSAAGAANGVRGAVMTRRRAVGTAGAAMGGSALAACGPRGGGSEAKPAAGSVSAGGTVRYFTWGSAFSDAIENKVIDAFHGKQSAIRVEFTNSQSDHFTKLQAAIAGGDPPDTALVDGYDIRALIKRGGAADLTARMQRDGVKREDYIESWFDEFLYNGEVPLPPEHARLHRLVLLQQGPD